MYGVSTAGRWTLPQINIETDTPKSIITRGVDRVNRETLSIVNELGIGRVRNE